ncbi:hypothetical protein DL771_007056 [Monosporascus sp. 5C6A]|nr:hypothetical protein DL771_007056 [Monosporascus sp. 5C6A]
MMSPPSTIYYTAAAIYAISIPGHIAFGHQHADIAVDKIPTSKELALGKATAATAWTWSIWARTGGPKSAEETLIVWITAIASSYVAGWYFKVKS